MLVYRQGDILIKPVAEIPAGAKQAEPILAYGEATGHAHCLTGDGLVFRDPESQRLFVKVMGGSASVVHDEHRTVALQPGLYEVIGQREYQPDEIRRVAD